MDTLHCYDCRADLPRQFFARDRSHKSGKRSVCRACASKAFRDWYLLNKAHVVCNVLRNRQRKQIIKAAGVEHSMESRIDGKSPLRVFYELTTRIEEESEDEIA